MNIFNRKTEEEKLEELIELADISDEELKKLNYKEKQAHYRAKTKLCKVFYNGNGPYRKKEEK